MKQLLLDASWHVTSELSVNVKSAAGVGPSVAHLEETAPDQSAYLPARLASHNSGPALH